MKILLTGAAGFLGARAKDALEKRGHAVVGTDKAGGMGLLKGDLAARSFTEALPDADAVIHTAAVQYVTRDLPFWNRESFFHRNNLEATKNLLRRYAGTTTHFINVATSMMYRQDGSPCYGISSPLQGQGVYSRSKVEALGLVEASGITNASVVPCIIGGPGREGLFRSFVGSLVRFGFAAIPGSGVHPVSMVHVDDVASLIVSIAEARATGRYNAAAPEPLSISDWVREIADELAIPAPRIIRVPRLPVHVISAMTRYRLLAREQLLMLKWPHVLDTRESLALGWQPRLSNAAIARSIGRYVAESL